MATDYTITLENQLGVVGIGPPVLWGAMIWGTDVWGSNADLLTHVQKSLSNDLDYSDSLSTLVNYGVLFEYDFGFVGDLGSEELTDSNSWNYVFPSNTIDGEERDFPEYTETV